MPLTVTAEWILREWSPYGGDGSGSSDRLSFVGVPASSGNTASAPPAAYGQILDIDTVEGSARLGRLIVDPARRGAGLGREFVKELLEICFGDLGLRRVTLRVFRWNKPAILCYLSAGFEVEGILPEAVSYEGESWDTVLMGRRGRRHRGRSKRFTTP